MSQTTPKQEDLPVWARDDAFPQSPEGWGWLDIKGRQHACETRDLLIEAIRTDLDAGVALVWIPGASRMILPDELDGAGEAVLSARKRRASDDLQDAVDKLRWFGWLMAGLAIYLLYQGFMAAPQSSTMVERGLFALRGMVTSMSMGIALLMFLTFAFIPWYQSHKRLRELARWAVGDTAEVVPTIRFETWLEWQKSPVTKLLMGLVALVGLAQLMPGDSLSAAGLVKPAYLGGEWWRLLTAPFMHGNLIHFLMNAAALLYLGKRVEVFARWPHVTIVFLFAGCIGGAASATFLAAPSVGASGGLMGWLGFLLVFESLHGELVPRGARRRLLAGVFLTALIGLVGYRFIDNAAHLGGLLAGMIYAVIVFPKSTSPLRPFATVTDRIVGTAVLGILAASAVFATFKILTVGAPN